MDDRLLVDVLVTGIAIGAVTGAVTGAFVATKAAKAFGTDVLERIGDLAYQISIRLLVVGGIIVAAMYLYQR